MKNHIQIHLLNKISSFNMNNKIASNETLLDYIKFFFSNIRKNVLL